MAGSTARRKTPPKTTRGELLEASIRGEMAELGVEPTSTEEELIKVAHSLADRLDDLQAIIDEEGLIIINSRNDQRTHPAAAEYRATATNLARVLGGIVISDTVTTPRKNPVKQKAARRRWDRETPGMAGRRRDEEAG
jgi:hypothetical protein